MLIRSRATQASTSEVRLVCVGFQLLFDVVREASIRLAKVLAHIHPCHLHLALEVQVIGAGAVVNVQNVELFVVPEEILLGPKGGGDNGIKI